MWQSGMRNNKAEISIPRRAAQKRALYRVMPGCGGGLRGGIAVAMIYSGRYVMELDG